MNNIQNPGRKPCVLSAAVTNLLEAAPGSLDSSSLASSSLASSSLASASPWLDFWRKVSVLAEELDAKELDAKELNAKEK